jgi:DNA-binding response OmpR family regulator
MNQFVLVADDEPMIRTPVSRVLEARGHEVLALGTAGEALDAIRQRRPDVAIIDWKMPGGGEAVVQELLNTGEFGGRIIIISGAQPNVFSGLLSHEKVAYLRKPFSFAHLVDLVERGEVG